MNTDVFHPIGSFKDMQQQIKDVIASVLMENMFEPNDSVLRAVIAGQIKEQLQVMAKKVGGENAPAVQVGFNDLAAAEVNEGKLSGHVDVGVRFYFTVKPE